MSRLMQGLDKECPFLCKVASNCDTVASPVITTSGCSRSISLPPQLTTVDDIFGGLRKSSKVTSSKKKTNKKKIIFVRTKLRKIEHFSYLKNWPLYLCCLYLRQLDSLHL